MEALQITFNHSKHSTMSILYLVVFVSLELSVNCLLVYLWICYFDITFADLRLNGWTMFWVITSNFCLQNFYYLLMSTIKLRLVAMNRSLW
jgi:hypothetical protein